MALSPLQEGLLGLTLHKTLGSMSLRLDKDLYYVGDVIPIYFSYPSHKEESENGNSYSLTVTNLRGDVIDVLSYAYSVLNSKYWNTDDTKSYYNVFDFEVASGSMSLDDRISRDVIVTLQENTRVL